jgi:DNA primase catalytic core
METPISLKKDKLQGRKTLRVAGFLEEFEKDDVKKNVDIVELFASFGVDLKKVGKGYMGLCPFHEDHNPSLSVDREKGLFNCFGCGESGDAFDLVEKMKNFDFKEALKFLKGWRGLSSYSPEPAPLPFKAEKKEEPKPVIIEAIDLNAVVDYYHKKLYDNPKALQYLQKRGLRNAENYSRFNIGFADGSLLDTLSDNQKEALKQSGIITDPSTGSGTAREHFQNCLIFPIFDDNLQVVSMYGRDIDDASTFKHRYLKGPHKGVFNRKASKVYDEILLAESIIDALSLIEVGIEGTQSIYGTNGFTDEHLEILKDGRVKTVILALDNDEAGRNASEKLKERLITEGFRVKVISPFGGKGLNPKDWNEALTSGKLLKEDLQSLIEQAAVFEKDVELKEGFKAREDKGQYYFTCLDMVYRLTGVKEVFANSLKVTVKAGLASSPDGFFVDTVDLYVYRSRAGFASHLAGMFNIEARRVERDLLNILEHLEKQREKKLENEKPSAVVITDSQRETALNFLKSPEMLTETAQDLETLGYAGEDTNKKLVYLAGTSRLLMKPLSIYIQSGAGSGKSYLIDTVLKLMPPEKVNSITSASDRAMNYLEEEKLLDSILAMGEALHSEDVEADIRQMQSENMIARSVTMKDPKTGEMKTVEIKKKVRLSFMMTSTALKLNPENASRCLVLNVDESKEQTGLVHQMQRHKRTVEGYLEERHVVPKIIEKHVTAQRLLTRQKVFNSFSPYVRFPQMKAIYRRAQEQFLTLIDSVCFLRQFQKSIGAIVDPYTNQEIEGIDCGLTDYETSRKLFIDGGLMGNIYDFSPGLVELYEEIRKLCVKRAKKENLKPIEVTLIQTDVRDLTGLGSEGVKKYMRMLVEYEFLQLVGGKRHGTRFCYRLREDEPIKGINLEQYIPTVQEIQRLMKEEKRLKL